MEINPSAVVSIHCQLKLAVHADSTTAGELFRARLDHQPVDLDFHQAGLPAGQWSVGESETFAFAGISSGYLVTQFTLELNGVYDE